MPKYSTGRSGGGDGDSCELCGAESSDLSRANVAGADLLVCANCAPHDDRRKRTRSRGRDGSGGDDGRPESRKKRAARNAARLQDAGRVDANFEERGTNYETDRLPYLVTDYGETVAAAREAEGLDVAALAAEVGVDEEVLVAVEAGRATRAGVGGSTICELEKRLDVDLVDE